MAMVKKIELLCEGCGKKFYKTRRQISRRGKRFCTHSCYTDSVRKSTVKKCSECGADVKRTQAQLKRSKSGRVFCNRSCATSFNNRMHKSGANHPNYINGFSAYRKSALDYYGPQCSNNNCPIAQSKISVQEKMLDVHHIDGDRSNNDISNLQVLCVWCHAELTRNV